MLRDLRLIALVQVKMAPVFGIPQHLARFGEHRLGYRRGHLYATILGQEIGFAPLFPRFQVLALDLRRKPDAEPLFEMQADYRHSRAARKVGALFPQRPVRGLVAFSNLQMFDRVYTPNGLIGFSPVYVSTLLVSE